MWNLPQYVKFAIVCEICHCMWNLPQYVKSTTVCEICHFMWNLPPLCEICHCVKFATICEICHCMWILPLYVKFTMCDICQWGNTLLFLWSVGIYIFLILVTRLSLCYARVGANIDYFVWLVKGSPCSEFNIMWRILCFLLHKNNKLSVIMFIMAVVITTMTICDLFSEY